MKTLLALLFTAALFLAGCKKQGAVLTDTRLLKTITYTRGAETWADNFSYDDNDRIIAAGSTNSNEHYTYTYGSDNNLKQVSIYEAGNVLTFVEKYRYTADSVIVQQYAADGVTPYQHYAYILNSKKQVIKFDGFGHTLDYTRDSRGNIANVTSHEPGLPIISVDYTYDDKPSPFAGIGISNLQVTFLPGNGMKDNANNLLKARPVGDTYTYTYLANGLPASRDGGGGISAKYDYLKR